MVTESDAAAELQLYGTIVRSNGEWLDLRIRAVDATKNVWFDKIFTSQASAESDTRQGDEGTPEFKAISTENATELAALLERMGDAAVSNIKGTSLIRYASELAPTTFSEYIEQTDDGTLRLLRLPARNDPMLIRIETIRNTEFVITDAVDAKYREFKADLARTYRVWREYRRKVGDYEASNIRFAAAKADDVERGSWESIKHQYDAYKYDRITAQERDRLAVAFNNEVEHTVEAMEIRVAELDDWVEKGSLEWHSLLEELYELETEMTGRDN